MVAKNKLTGTTFKVLTESKKSFKGKVINDPTGTWKKGECCSNLDKQAFSLLVNWDFFDNIKSNIREIKFYSSKL